MADRTEQDRAALLRHVEAQEQEVERLRACVIACGEVVLVEGNWRDLTPMVLNSIVKYVRENAAAERKLARLVEAAKKVRHWRDTHDGGMVVSGESVRGLWEATKEATGEGK